MNWQRLDGLGKCHVQVMRETLGIAFVARYSIFLLEY